MTASPLRSLGSYSRFLAHLLDQPGIEGSNPNDLTLASTMPHHKHVPPDIKHHRIPAPEISFDRPNLPVLIQEIAEVVKDEAS